MPAVGHRSYCLRTASCAHLRTRRLAPHSHHHRRPGLRKTPRAIHGSAQPAGKTSVKAAKPNSVDIGVNSAKPSPGPAQPHQATSTTFDHPASFHEPLTTRSEYPSTHVTMVSETPNNRRKSPIPPENRQESLVGGSWRDRDTHLPTKEKVFC